MEERFSKQQRMYRPKLHRAGEDTISKLPDSLLSQILSHLPTKDTVRTSVLSHRWKSVYLLVPSLDMSSSEFPGYSAFVSFIEKILAFSREGNSVLYKLKISIQKDENAQSCVTRWIDFVATPKLNHLDVECTLANRKFLEAIPQSLYIECDTLVYLRLHRVSMGEYKSVSLPCLKTMRLEHNVYASDASLEIFISSCPVLEDLTIVRMVPDNVKVLRVRSQSLPSCHVDRLFGEGDDYVNGLVREGSWVLIDAPRLKYLKFEDDLTDSKIITNPVSLEKVNIVFVFGEHDFTDVDLPKRNMVRSFFNSISGVKEMKISAYTMEFLDYNREYETYDPLPQFCNVSTLNVGFYVSNLDMMMPTLLESFPNLKSLFLKLDFYDPSREEEAADIRLSSVPPCLLSSLEAVKIKRFNRGPANMEVARYFLENSQVLKKLVLDFRCSALI